MPNLGKTVGATIKLESNKAKGKRKDAQTLKEKLLINTLTEKPRYY